MTQGSCRPSARDRQAGLKTRCKAADLPESQEVSYALYAATERRSQDTLSLGFWNEEREWNLEWERLATQMKTSRTGRFRFGKTSDPTVSLRP